MPDYQPYTAHVTTTSLYAFYRAAKIDRLACMARHDGDTETADLLDTHVYAALDLNAACNRAAHRMALAQ